VVRDKDEAGDKEEEEGCEGETDPEGALGMS